jgi:multidrug transporter EmrE-like cation transporter
MGHERTGLLGMLSSIDRGTLLQVAFIAGCVLFAGGGNLLLKSGMRQMGSVSETDLPKLQYALQTLLKPQIMVGIVLYVASFVMWLSLLSMMDISMVYPIFVSAAFILVSIGSIVWFGEPMNGMRVLGTLVVMLGIALVSISGRH